MLPKANWRVLTSGFLAQLLLPLVGIFVLVSVFPQWEPPEHRNILLTYVLFTIVCSFAPINTINARLTLNSAVMLSGIILFGAWAAVWSAFIEILIVSFIFKTQWNKALANFGQLVCSVWVVALVYEWFNRYSIPWMITDFILVILFWFVNTALCSIGIAHFYQEKWMRIFGKMMKSGTFTYLLLMEMGAIGTRLIGSFGPLSLLPIIIAFVLLRFLFHQYFANLNKLEQKVEEINSLNHSFLTALAASIDARDPYTSGHSQRVAHWGREIANSLGLPKQQVDKVYFGGILHDVGKIGIEDDILNKDGRLSPDEFDRIKRHTVIGYEIVKQAGVFEDLLPAVRSHHERIDGRGYPDGLQGEDIPLIARILAIADAFDAMVSDRPYRRGMPVEKALQEIKEGAGTHFDQRLAQEFIEIIKQIPEDQLLQIIGKNGENRKRQELKEAVH